MLLYNNYKGIPATYDVYTMKYRKEKHTYADIAMSLDTETTSVLLNTGSNFEDKTPLAWVYIWQIAINGVAYYGRTLEELKIFLDRISDELKEDKIVCYVHNLKFDFSFLRGILNFENVFALDAHNVIKATYRNIEFRCSYALSNLSLEKIAENYCSIPKLKGDLDYSKVRFWDTRLTEQEMKYCEYDVLILNEYYYNYIRPSFVDKAGGITNIPLTCTSIVRNYVKNELRQDKNVTKIRASLRESFPSNEVFLALKQAFIGGVCHANYIHAFKDLHNVDMYDLTSDYPSQMLHEQFPVSQFIKIKPTFTNIKKYRKTQCYMVRAVFHNVKAIKKNHILSESKCLKTSNVVCDNGRIISADMIEVMFTDIDYEYFFKFYECNHSESDLKLLYVAYKGRLPKYLVKSMYEFYKGKKTLKGVAGKEQEYLRLKGMLNSIYGMMVTSPIRDLYEWDLNVQGFNRIMPDVNSKLADLRNDYGIFNLYAWGVWVTARARASLYSAILGEVLDDNGKKIKFTDEEVSNDEYVIYYDTDSAKFVENTPHLKEFIDCYNMNINRKTKEACDYYGFDYSILKGIGEWDNEGVAKKFKTFGAKRYAFIYYNKKSDKDEIVVKCAGMSQDGYNKYCKDNNYDSYKKFGIGLSLDAVASKRLESYYNDGIPVDTIYQDHEIHATHYCALIPTTWKMDVALEYKDLVEGTF